MGKKRNLIDDTVWKNEAENKELKVGILKASFNLIPFLGPFINEVLFDIGARIQETRFKEFVETLSLKIDNLEKRQFKEDYFKSDDFYDITRKVFQSALNIKQKEKREALSNIYLSSIIDSALVDETNHLLFTEFIDSLAPIQIQILRFVEENKQKLNQISKYSTFYHLFTNNDNSIIDKYKFKYYGNDLEAKALISFEDGLEAYDSHSQEMVFQGHKYPSVIITNLGKEFLNYL